MTCGAGEFACSAGTKLAAMGMKFIAKAENRSALKKLEIFFAQKTVMSECL
jgi:hypothetical protein